MIQTWVLKLLLKILICWQSKLQVNRLIFIEKRMDDLPKMKEQQVKQQSVLAKKRKNNWKRVLKNQKIKIDYHNWFSENIYCELTYTFWYFSHSHTFGYKHSWNIPYSFHIFYRKTPYFPHISLLENSIFLLIVF